MKLSVCIPVYNFDISELVIALVKEIQENNINAEIILIDDASDEGFIQKTNALKRFVKEIVYLPKNIGRSKIRNLFLKYTEGNYLLFLDCDAKIINPHFLQNYIDEVSKHNDLEIVYGSFIVSNKNAHTLRNCYSVEREMFKGDRSGDYSYFKTVNFIIKREVFQKYPFDEALLNYGYEDYIFIQKLKHAKVKFVAINNPVEHYDDTPNVVFLNKTKEAIDTLYRYSQDPANAYLLNESKLYMMALKFKKRGIKPLFLFIYKCFEKSIMENLRSDTPNIHYFDMFKLKLLLKKI